MIRFLTVLDAGQVVTLGHAMAMESPRARPLGFDEERARKFIDAVITSESFICLGAFEGDQLVGFLIAMCGQIHPFSTAVVSHEEYLYVSPSHRSTPAGRDLIAEFIRDSEERGATQIEIRNATGVRPEVVERFYRRCGFERVGGLFVKGVDHVRR